jgi:hypothetical protein
MNNLYHLKLLNEIKLVASMNLVGEDIYIELHKENSPI